MLRSLVGTSYRVPSRRLASLSKRSITKKECLRPQSCVVIHHRTIRAFPRTATTLQHLCNAGTSTAPFSSKVDQPPLQQILPPQPMDSRRLYRYLQLETFSKEELHGKFDEIVNSGRAKLASPPPLDENTERSPLLSTLSSMEEHEKNSIRSIDIASFLERRIQEEEDANPNLMSSHDNETTARMRADYAATNATQFVHFFVEDNKINSSDDTDTNRMITRDQFTLKLIDSATSVDFKRSWPITVSMLLVGSSVGVVIPAMPFVVQNLGLTAGEYGLVVSAFALAKMSGNIPSAVLVERHGRKVRGRYICGGPFAESCPHDSELAECGDIFSNEDAICCSVSPFRIAVPSLHIINCCLWSRRYRPGD
jgi:hypothetical protein